MFKTENNHNLLNMDTAIKSETSGSWEEHVILLGDEFVKTQG